MSENENSPELAQPPWARASLADATACDFEAPITDLKAADCLSLAEAFGRAAQPRRDGSTLSDTPALRVFSMLSALTGMHFRPHDPNEPFGPMLTLADGQRSAIPSDFRTGVDVIANMAGRATNPVLRARLCDVSWLLDRKRSLLGTSGISSYVELVQLVDQRILRFAHHAETEDQALSRPACDLLRRALQIGNLIGRDKEDVIIARNLVEKLRRRAVSAAALASTLWFSTLDFDFKISTPDDVAAEIERLLKGVKSEIDINLSLELLRQARRGYRLAKRVADSNRCQNKGADRLIAEVEKHKGSSMLSAHWLSAAIHELHGLPDKKAKRTRLRHRLINIQAHIPEQASVFAQPFDVEGIVEPVQEGMKNANLSEKLFIFVHLASSPDPAELREEAIKAIAEHPLQSLFGTVHLDSEGKAIHRTEGGLHSEDAIERQIALAESIRRNIVAVRIEASREAINSCHFISEDVLSTLLSHSPFVPNDLLLTFSRGFNRLFQGDFIGALYVLTPLLENSLRHVLKAHGYEVTNFDDEDQTQEDRTISSLFEQMRSEMEGIFSKGIVADIDHVFLNKPGPSLRHRLAHGLLHDGSAFSPDALYGCWLMFQLCCLPLLPYWKQFEVLNTL
jgi:hypothetical protein